MSYREDPRLAEANNMPVDSVVHMLGIEGLRRSSAELIGPCPLCGGNDRFGINLRTQKHLCRKCGIQGGDLVGLVMSVRGLKFPDALSFLCGDLQADITPEEREARKKRAAAAERKRHEEAEKFRRWAISAARQIWSHSRPGSLGVVRAYLSARGITAEMLPHIPDDLHFISAHPYVKKHDGAAVEMHKGPAMIAAVRNPLGEIDAVHQTWVSSQPPHGKAEIVWNDEQQASKLVRGSKKGGAIRLITPRGAEVMVMGEGIETTLTAAACWPAVLGPKVAYWAGVDLGNMSGKMRRIAGKRHSGLPDLNDDDAFVPPVWVKRLIFIQDGDSDAKATRAKLESGLKRAMYYRQGLKAQIVHAGAGVDLNDVLTTCGDSSAEKE
jgi:hypothetical protein